MIVVIVAYAWYTYFSSGASCTPQNGFYCETQVYPPPINKNFTINFGFGEYFSPSLSYVALACTSSNSTTAPSESEFTAIGSVQGMSQVPTSNGGSTTIGQRSVSSLRCYDAGGSLITSLPPGSEFNANIWINYSNNTVGVYGYTVEIAAHFRSKT